MSIISTVFNKIREAIGRMIPYQSIEQAERIETPLTTEMINAVELWYQMYLDQPPWQDIDGAEVKTLNLPSFIASEMARQILLEVKWSITGKKDDGQTKDDDGEEVMNPRAEFLKEEFEQLIDNPQFRAKLEQGCAAGGMIIKPYPNTQDGRIHFDWAMDWGFYPIAFDDDGNLVDFIIPDVFREGKTIYTRLERHTMIPGTAKKLGKQQEGGQVQKASTNTSQGAGNDDDGDDGDGTRTTQKPAGATQDDGTGKQTGAQQKSQQKGAVAPKQARRETGRVRITQRAFKSTVEDSLGREINLTDVDRWASLQPEAIVTETDSPLIGWFRVAAANNIDVDSPLGASVYAKAAKTIEQADLQYSRVLWEYEGSELAIDVDPSALRPRKIAGGGVEMPKLNQRLFRAVDIDKGDRDLYEVFAPQIRDSSLFAGLNQLLMRIEDQCGLSRGTIADAVVEARTATELKILRSRSFATIADNQTALEKCLKDVVKAMDKYATIYHLAPEGEYDVSFEWDDSILTDTEQQMNERLMLVNAGMMGRVEFRMWYFGETRAQAEAAIEAITKEKTDQMEAMNPMLPSLGGGAGSPPDGGKGQDGQKDGGDGKNPPQGQDGGQKSQPGPDGKQGQKGQPPKMPSPTP